jgi:hypothetical protein
MYQLNGKLTDQNVSVRIRGSIARYRRRESVFHVSDDDPRLCRVDKRVIGKKGRELGLTLVPESVFAI